MRALHRNHSLLVRSRQPSKSGLRGAHTIPYARARTLKPQPARQECSPGCSALCGSGWAGRRSAAPPPPPCPSSLQAHGTGPDGNAAIHVPFTSSRPFYNPQSAARAQRTAAHERRSARCFADYRCTLPKVIETFLSAATSPPSPWKRRLLFGDRELSSEVSQRAVLASATSWGTCLRQEQQKIRSELKLIIQELCCIGAALQVPESRRCMLRGRYNVLIP